MKDKLRIISKGNGKNTKIYLGNKELNNVTDIKILINATGINLAILRIKDVEFDVEVEKYDIKKEKIKLKPVGTAKGTMKSPSGM